VWRAALIEWSDNATAARHPGIRFAQNNLSLDAAIHDAVVALPPDERRDRAKVNEAVRDGLKLGPLRPAGSADQYGVPRRRSSVPQPAK